MSAKVTGFILDHYPHGGAEKLVALALADEANAEGDHIFPGVARLATRCCMSERGIQKILRRIEERQIGGVHWFEKVRVGGGGRSLTNHYRCPIARLDDVLRGTVNDVRGIENETPNGVQGKNPEHDSGFGQKPRTQGSETPNGGSPNPLYPPNQTEPARDDAQVPTMVSEWGNLLTRVYGYSNQDVLNVKAIVMFRDWIERGLSVGLVCDAIDAAHAKNGGRPGSPSYYRNFVNQMEAEHTAAADERERQPMLASRSPGVSHGQVRATGHRSPSDNFWDRFGGDG